MDIFTRDTVATCGGCSKPMIPNLSQSDEEGYAWICTTPGCSEFAGSEVESEDLIACGCPAWLAYRIQALADSLL